MKFTDERLLRDKPYPKIQMNRKIMDVLNTIEKMWLNKELYFIFNFEVKNVSW